MKAASTIATGPVPAPDGETPQQAADRLFPEQYSFLTSNPDNRKEIARYRGAKPGPPVAVLDDYQTFFHPLLARWIVQADDVEDWQDTFSAMKPAEMSKKRFIVPMVKDGNVVSEFVVNLNDEGHWEEDILLATPGGQLHEYRSVRRRLEKALGPGTEVRLALFLPSGLELAVGRNGSREMSMCFGAVDHDDRVSFDGTYPSFGEVLSSDDLEQLLDN